MYLYRIITVAGILCVGTCTYRGKGIMPVQGSESSVDAIGTTEVRRCCPGNRSDISPADNRWFQHHLPGGVQRIFLWINRCTKCKSLFNIYIVIKALFG